MNTPSFLFLGVQSFPLFEKDRGAAPVRRYYCKGWVGQQQIRGITIPDEARIPSPTPVAATQVMPACGP